MYARFTCGAAAKAAIAVVWLVAFADSSVLVPRFTNDSCAATCTAFDIVRRYYWQKQDVTATLTAATVIYIVDDRTNTTRTSTKTNELPAGVTPPPVNAQGTHVTTIQIETAPGESSELELAYPTKFTNYPVEYGWYGTLPTVNANGQSTCSVVNRTVGIQYVDYSTYPTPVQTGVDPVDTTDPSGYIYSLMGYGCYEPAETTINPNDAAPKACQPLIMCGVSALSTVRFLTETSVSHETSTPDPTPPPRDPAPPPEPAPPNEPAPPQDPSPPAQPVQQPTPPAAGATGGNVNPAPQPTPGNGQSPPQQPRPTPTPTPVPAPIVIGSQTVSANPQSNFVIGGQTLSQGSQIVAGGTTISLAQGGSIAVVNGATQSLFVPQPAPSPILNVNGVLVTANPAGEFVVGGSTVAVGSAVTLGSGASRTTVSLTTDTSGQTVAVVNGRTSTLSAGSTAGGVGDAVASGLGSTGNGVEQFTGAGSRCRNSWHALIIPLLGLLV